MKWQSRICLIFFGGILFAGLLGCSFSSSGIPPTLTEPPKAETTGTDTPDATAPTTGLKTPAGSCLGHDPGLLLPRSSYEDYPEIIGGFLTKGGMLENLDQGLYDAGMLGQPVGIQAGDFDGNGKVDIAVVLINPASALVTPEGKLLVYLCLNGEYQVHEIQPPPGEDYPTPIIKFNEDLNADKRPELVAGFGSCSAHTCFEALGIYSWQQDEFTDLLAGSTTDLPYPDVSLEGPDQNGYYAIKLSASGFGSVGAGPQREIIRVYTYDSGAEQWTRFAEKPGASSYRIHTLHDAEYLAAGEKFMEALILYQQVVSNDLQDWQAPEIERANLAAYARYKIVAVYTLLGREEIAEAALAEFEAAVTAGSSQASYLEMAQIFRREGSAEEWSRACSAVRDYALEKSEQILAPLGPLAFGYANREFTAEDICPWK